MNAKDFVQRFLYRDDLIDKMKTTPFAICIDGSNDQGLEKMYPILVKIWDSDTHKIENRFLDLCTIKGKDSSSAEDMLESAD